MGRGGGGLPLDWVGCPKLSDGLVEDLFFAFKTPLSPSLNRGVNQDLQFHLKDVFDELQRFQKDKVLWIDLTNTDRYYPKQEVVNKEKFSYVKMAMLGHGLPPSSTERNEFNLAVDVFVKENPNGLVAVHCTHGFNRTGYLISYYLMTRKGFSAHDAVTKFKIKRPPGIYRKRYVDHLFQLEQGSSGIPGLINPIPDVETPPWVTAATDNKGKHNRLGWNGHGGSRGRYNQPKSSSEGVELKGNGLTMGINYNELSNNRSNFADDDHISNFDPRNQWDQRHYSHSHHGNNYNHNNYHYDYNNWGYHNNIRKAPLHNDFLLSSSHDQNWRMLSSSHDQNWRMSQNPYNWDQYHRMGTSNAPMDMPPLPIFQSYPSGSRKRRLSGSSSAENQRIQIRQPGPSSSRSKQ